jgi:hypothetical protein
MQRTEIAERKLVVRLAPRRVTIVDSEAPFSVLFETVNANEFIFLCNLWLVASPAPFRCKTT